MQGEEIRLLGSKARLDLSRSLVDAAFPDVVDSASGKELLKAQPGVGCSCVKQVALARDDGNHRTTAPARCQALKPPLQLAAYSIQGCRIATIAIARPRLLPLILPVSRP